MGIEYLGSARPPAERQAAIVAISLCGNSKAARYFARRWLIESVLLFLPLLAGPFWQLSPGSRGRKSVPTLASRRQKARGLTGRLAARDTPSSTLDEVPRSHHRADNPIGTRGLGSGKGLSDLGLD